MQLPYRKAVITGNVKKWDLSHYCGQAITRRQDNKQERKGARLPFYFPAENECKNLLNDTWLYRTNRIFQQAIDECIRIVFAICHCDIEEALFNSMSANKCKSKLEERCAVIALQYALVV